MEVRIIQFVLLSNYYCQLKLKKIELGKTKNACLTKTSLKAKFLSLTCPLKLILKGSGTLTVVK